MYGMHGPAMCGYALVSAIPVPKYEQISIDCCLVIIIERKKG
jgi:hypothetical protein